MHDDDEWMMNMMLHINIFILLSSEFLTYVNLHLSSLVEYKVFPDYV